MEVANAMQVREAAQALAGKFVNSSNSSMVLTYDIMYIHRKFQLITLL